MHLSFFDSLNNIIIDATLGASHTVSKLEVQNWQTPWQRSLRRRLLMLRPYRQLPLCCQGTSHLIKLISKINVKASKIESLKEEAKLLQTLSHQSIVKIF